MQQVNEFFDDEIIMIFLADQTHFFLSHFHSNIRRSSTLHERNLIYLRHYNPGCTKGVDAQDEDRLYASHLAYKPYLPAGSSDHE